MANITKAHIEASMIIIPSRIFYSVYLPINHTLSNRLAILEIFSRHLAKTFLVSSENTGQFRSSNAAINILILFVMNVIIYIARKDHIISITIAQYINTLHTK